jgi:ferric iron reductase protein FhuF
VSRPGPPATGVVEVPAERLGTAVRRAGAHNPLLGIAVGTQAGVPAARWYAPDAGVAAELIDAVGDWLGTGERRVAASMVVLGYAARLVGPGVAVLLREDILVDLRPDRVTFAFTPDRGFQLAVPEPAGWRGPPQALCDRWCRDVVGDHLQAVINSVRQVVPVAAGLLWGNVASSVAGALAALVRDGAVSPERAHAAGGALLSHGLLRGTGALSVGDRQLLFARRSCCLYYRLDGGGMCADCSLLRAG